MAQVSQFDTSVPTAPPTLPEGYDAEKSALDKNKITKLEELKALCDDEPDKAKL